MKRLPYLHIVAGSTHSSRNRHAGLRIAAGLVILFLAAGAFFLLSVRFRKPDAKKPRVPQVVAERTISPLARLRFPTPREYPFRAPWEEVFQPTVSGRMESALYGSVRTANRGGRIFPSFHEGIDIAPVSRTGAGRARDSIFAVADGRVAYANRSPGRSNYGIYVVLLHQDPVGEVYTLYAHLAELAGDMEENKTVRKGDVLGIMGNTPDHIIPLHRSHLHFEIGMVLNRRFTAWARKRDVNNLHGRMHGWNLQGIDPLKVFEDQHRRGKDFCMGSHLANLPTAFKLLVPARKLPDYFRRYPALWKGEVFKGPALVLACSEGGVPIEGRPATDEEAALLSDGQPVVLFADPDVLGRNGARLVARRDDTNWTLGSQGPRWLEIIMY